MVELVVDNSGFGEWRRKLIMNERNRMMDCRENVYLILANHPAWKGIIGFDEFSNRLVIRKKPEIQGFEPGDWQMQHDLLLGLWLSQVEHLVVRSEKNLALAVSLAASEQRFHPVREFLEDLEWDETPRLDDWLTDCMGVKKTPYSVLAGRYFILNMVARIYRPGCIMRSVPVLEGAQNMGKSTALRALGGEWFADTHFDVGSKDSYQSIQGVWVYEIPEMSAFTKVEVARVKEFVSSREDNFRPPYERRNVKVLRQVVFAGTTNDSIYLKDWTGNTRFWPVRVAEDGELDADQIGNMREQLLAEAVVAFKRGDRRHPTREEEAELFVPEQQEREVEHPWTSLVAGWLENDTTRDRVMSNDVLFDCLKFEPSKVLDSHAITVGKIMMKLGWARQRETSGARRWYYRRPVREQVKVSNDEPLPV